MVSVLMHFDGSDVGFFINSCDYFNPSAWVPGPAHGHQVKSQLSCLFLCVSGILWHVCTFSMKLKRPQQANGFQHLRCVHLQATLQLDVKPADFGMDLTIFRAAAEGESRAVDSLRIQSSAICLSSERGKGSVTIPESLESEIQGFLLSSQ